MAKSFWRLRFNFKSNIFTKRNSKIFKLTLNKNNIFIRNIEKFGTFNVTEKNRFNIAEKLVEKSPVYIHPYLKLARLHSPVGSWLIFWPCSWSISLAAAASTFPDLYLLTLFGIGSFVMRGAACTINDMWDRDIDRRVLRTMDRPLVNGTMNMPQAFLFLAGELSAALFILLQLNWYSVMLGASSLGFAIIYPLMKRITYWPQVMLGLTLNWGIFLGYSAVHGFVDWNICIPMYVSAVCWTIIYDTIYAHQDISDDIRIGMKSTAIIFKENTKYWLTGFSTIMISCLIYEGLISGQTMPYYSAVGFVASHLTWQICHLNIYDPKDCASKFASNHQIGFILFIGIVLGNLLKSKKENENNCL